MNKIYNLLDEQYILELFKERVLPRYPDFKSIEKVTISPIKKNIWGEKNYHVVISYETTFTNNDGETVVLPIFTSAHDSEPRKNVFTALTYLWNSSFSGGSLTIPHPLFFSEHYNAVFYRGVDGKNLFHYIKHKDYPEIERLVGQTALWLAKLHSLPAGPDENFNEINSRVETIIPGRTQTLELIKTRYGQEADNVAKCYSIIIGREEAYLKTAKKLCLIHGDAHSENVIRVSAKKTAMIDFTDICLGDFARDLGAFSQQFEFKCRKIIDDQVFIENTKKLFLSAYLDIMGLTLTGELEERIKTYYYWTNVRTAIFLYLFHNPQPERARDLIQKTLAAFKEC